MITAKVPLFNRALLPFSVLADSPWEYVFCVFYSRCLIDCTLCDKVGPTVMLP